MNVKFTLKCNGMIGNCSIRVQYATYALDARRRLKRPANSIHKGVAHPLSRASHLSNTYISLNFTPALYLLWLQNTHSRLFAPSARQ